MSRQLFRLASNRRPFVIQLYIESWSCLRIGTSKLFEYEVKSISWLLRVILTTGNWFGELYCNFWSWTGCLFTEVRLALSMLCDKQFPLVHIDVSVVEWFLLWKNVQFAVLCNWSFKYKTSSILSFDTNLHYFPNVYGTGLRTHLCLFSPCLRPS